jgi:type 1 fimbriae regulatory protein FimB/type 1 fimbriae regulatory protein FimE
MRKSALHSVRTEPAPGTEVDTHGPRREYVTEDEVERLLRAASKHERGDRDALMILMAYRHGLRVSELIGLQWAQIDLDAGRLRVIRLKGSDDSVHPLGGREIRALRKLRRGQPVGSRFVFVTSRGGPMTRNGFFKILAKAGQAVGMRDIHPHLLRHGTGFKLVNDGMDTLSLAAYLGHRNVQNTARYTKMDARRFDGLWKD